MRAPESPPPRTPIQPASRFTLPTILIPCNEWTDSSSFGAMAGYDLCTGDVILFSHSMKPLLRAPSCRMGRQAGRHLSSAPSSPDPSSRYIARLDIVWSASPPCISFLCPNRPHTGSAKYLVKRYTVAPRCRQFVVVAALPDDGTSAVRFDELVFETLQHR